VSISYVINKNQGGISLNYITLNNGTKMPQLGFGVWKIENKNMPAVLNNAFNTGFRSIDTASVYENEEGVGEGIAKSNISRDDLFITTKVRNKDHGYDNTLKAFEESLKKLKLDYVDQYLVHWPMPQVDKFIETYKALEKLYTEGRVRAIGVCNFTDEHLSRLMDECEIIPTVNQVECHVYLQQQKLKDFCQKHNIFLEAWSPLMQGEALQEKIIKEIANKYKKTAAQIIIRWHLQNKTIVIPKSSTSSRIAENYDVFDFELDNDSMDRIASLDKEKRQGPHPDNMNILE